MSNVTTAWVLGLVDYMADSVFSAISVDSAGIRGKRVLAAAWCSAKADLPLLAVAVEGGTVLVLEEDGSLHDEVVRNKPSNDIEARGKGGVGCEATCFTWSPAPVQGGNVLLGIGWSDGNVMVWSEKDRLQRTDDEAHSGAPISFISFSPDSSRMISGDRRVVGGQRQQDAAVLCVWKVDNKGRFSVLTPHKRPTAGSLTHAIFRTADAAAKKKLVASAFAAADMPPVYFGGETGTICMGTDMGSSSDIIPSLGAALSALHYMHERDILVVINAHFNLSTRAQAHAHVSCSRGPSHSRFQLRLPVNSHVQACRQ